MRNLLLLTFLFLAGATSAQQDPIFSQFFYQKNISNPAAAGSQGHPNLTAFHRQQWAGLEGAPSTQALSFSAPAFANRVGLGLALVNDRIGFFNTTFVNAAYAYRLRFEEATLSVGLQGSYLHQRADWAEAKTIGFGSDPNSTGDEFVPVFNAGVGGYFEREKFFVGLSVPQLLEKGFTQKSAGLVSEGNGSVRHLFAHAGLLVDVSPKVKMRPAVAARIVSNAPPSLDAHLSFGFLENTKLWLGGTWRWSQSEAASIGDALVLTSQYRIGERLTVGVAYDLSIGELQEQTAGTYELMVEYGIWRSEEGVRNPRYFE